MPRQDCPFHLGEHLVNDLAYFFRNACQRLLSLAPLGQGYSISRQGMERSKRGLLPTDRTQENGNSTGFSSLVELNGCWYFHSRAELRGEIVVAEKQKDQIRGSELVVNLFPPRCSRLNGAVIPFGNMPLLLEDFEMAGEPF